MKGYIKRGLRQLNKKLSNGEAYLRNGKARQETKYQGIHTEGIVDPYQVAPSTVFYKRSGQGISIYIFVSDRTSERTLVSTL